MTGKKDTYLYYFELGESAFRDKMKFYEEHNKLFDNLTFDKKIEIDIDYILCLFEVGRYERFLSFVDNILEIIIIENIYEYQGQNIFNELLLKKSACYYHIQQYQKSLKLIGQLIKINPEHPNALDLYSLCRRKIKDSAVINLKALAISSIFLALSITFSQIMFIEPFYETATNLIEDIRNSLVILSLVCFIIIEIYYQRIIYLETGKSPFRFLSKFLTQPKA